MITRYLIAGRRAIQDRNENDVTVVGVLEDFVAQGFPLLLARVAIIWAVEREAADPDDFQAVLRVTVDDTVLHEGPFNASFQGARVTRSILNMAGFAYPQPGVYRIAVLVDGQVKGEYRFRADAAPPSREGGTPTSSVATGSGFLAS